MEFARTTDWPHFPFCSERCRLIDLGRWLKEEYRVAPDSQGEAPGIPEAEDIP